jgi:hypothetical protein
MRSVISCSTTKSCAMKSAGLYSILEQLAQITASAIYGRPGTLLDIHLINHGEK